MGEIVAFILANYVRIPQCDQEGHQISPVLNKSVFEVGHDAAVTMGTQGERTETQGSRDLMANGWLQKVGAS